ncbi:MAG: hypothetical protein JXM70_02485 [Pirellulales bacterium]|nr:hypothetical protein [Pirellulales bacterium]
MKICVQAALVLLLSLPMFSCFTGSKQAWAGQNETPNKAPFRVLFSNDLTNTSSCVSPYHAEGQQWAPEMIEATVDETAATGVEVHMLQPAHTWVPWWPSKVYPLKEHYRWWKSHYGIDIPKMPVHEYIRKGGDPFKLFIERCRMKGLKPFISIRLNDGHHLENVDKKNNKRGAHSICKFYVDNPQYRIGPGFGSWEQRVQNWAIPEVRKYKFELIEEICRNYDITGLELDFMRHYSYFRLDKTTSKQRKAIMTSFVKDVRRVLDASSKNGEKRWLCVRIPCYLTMHDGLGIDVRSMAAAGVDMFNLSASYFTVHDADIAEISKMAPGGCFYLEMCHTVYVGKKVAKGYDSNTFRRTTPNQYYTAAHLAYSRGATGVSAFNFVYYREHGNGERGPFNEPPFHVFKNIGNPDWVAKQPQHYILAKMGLSKQFLQGKMPLLFDAAGQTRKFRMDMAPTKGGWKTDGKLRIQAEKDLADSFWTAKVNDVELKLASDLSEPYNNPYTPLLGDDKVHRGWIVPRDILKDGINNFEVTMKKGGKTRVEFIDLAIE